MPVSTLPTMAVVAAVEVTGIWLNAGNVDTVTTSVGAKGELFTRA